ncbi:hypothetical protein BDY21DRAFT_348306 [Lineolata rhizophorae]|uniref:Uncharacterized protein n=1 Tax=Lineolata rhizophorae TaxID=578093 RepID=A0A6A6NWZ8_9PEZI|nr:hypothetical protein BDY21DRAFT_348306 [Lineolata rhizophorae]
MCGFPVLGCRLRPQRHAYLWNSHTKRQLANKNVFVSTAKPRPSIHDTHDNMPLVYHQRLDICAVNLTWRRAKTRYKRNGKHEHRHGSSRARHEEGEDNTTGNLTIATVRPPHAPPAWWACNTRRRLPASHCLPPRTSARQRDGRVRRRPP